MNKKELGEKIAERAGITQTEAQKCIGVTLDTITEALIIGDRVSLVGFGTFSVSRREARKGRNPQTGEEISIAAANVPKFKPGKTLKDKCQQSL